MTTIRQINETVGANEGGVTSLIAFLADFGVVVDLDSELDAEQEDFVQSALRISKEIDGGKSIVDAFEAETGSSWDETLSMSPFGDIPSAAETRAAEAEFNAILDAYDAEHGYNVTVVPIFSGTPEEAVAFLRQHAGDEAADAFAAQVAAGKPGGHFSVPDEVGLELLQAKLEGGVMEGEATDSAE